MSSINQILKSRIARKMGNDLGGGFCSSVTVEEQLSDKVLGTKYWGCVGAIAIIGAADSSNAVVIFVLAPFLPIEADRSNKHLHHVHQPHNLRKESSLDI